MNFNMKKLISFSGIDGSGKTTQINTLVNTLKKQGLKCISYNDLPKTEPLDYGMTLNEYYEILVDYDVMVLRSCYRAKEHVEYLQYIKNTPHKKEDTFLLQKYFVRDTSIWFKKIILPLIKQDKTLIFDRYVYDELPYQMLFNEDVRLIKYLIQKLPQPVSFYMNIDVETMKIRNRDREDGRNKLFSSDEKIQRIINNYNNVFDNINTVRLDATKSVAENALIVRKYLGLEKEKIINNEVRDERV